MQQHGFDYRCTRYALIGIAETYLADRLHKFVDLALGMLGRPGVDADEVLAALQSVPAVHSELERLFQTQCKNSLGNYGCVDWAIHLGKFGDDQGRSGSLVATAQVSPDCIRDLKFHVESRDTGERFVEQFNKKAIDQKLVYIAKRRLNFEHPWAAPSFNRITFREFMDPEALLDDEVVHRIMFGQEVICCFADYVDEQNRWHLKLAFRDGHEVTTVQNPDGDPSWSMFDWIDDQVSTWLVQHLKA